MRKDEEEKYGRIPQKGRKRQKTKDILKKINTIDDKIEIEDLELEISLTQKIKR